MKDVQVFTVIALKDAAIALVELQRDSPEGATVLENLIRASDNLASAIQTYYAL